MRFLKKTRLIFFSNGVQHKKFNHYLLDCYDIITLPMVQTLKKNDIVQNQTLILIWFSKNDHVWLTKIKQILQSFPKIPIFLIADNPSNEDLLKIIPLGIKKVFTLPLKEKELASAIDEEINKNVLNKYYFKKIRGLSTDLQNFLKKIWKKEASEKFMEFKDVETGNVGIIPNLLKEMLDEKIENEYAFDLNVQFFGKFIIQDSNGKIKQFSNTKNTSLLGFLLYNHHKPIHREKLMERFWGEVAPTSARNSLNVAIHGIRNMMKEIFPDRETILFENDCYSVSPDLEIITDVDKFNYYWKKGQTIENTIGLKHTPPAYNRALGIYNDDFLYEMPYEEWCESIRDNLKETYLFILNRLAKYFFQREEYDACINICKKMIDKDGCLEEVHRKLMQCYCKLGLSGLAKKQYLKCESILKEELGIAPADATIKLFEKIQSGQCS